MANSVRNLRLTTVDDLFSTEETRQAEAKQHGEQVLTVPIAEIDDFPDHPFHVVEDEAMQEMRESVKQYGVLTPAVVRKKEDGRYELISGHRRKKACELAGLDSIPVVVRNMTRDEAIIFMVDSNLQREKVLPSEKAFSYKMKLEAMNSVSYRTETETETVTVTDEYGAVELDENGDPVTKTTTTLYIYVNVVSTDYLAAGER